MAEKKETDYIKMLEDLFAKAPALPKNIQEVLVQITPIFALIFGILGIIAGLSWFGSAPIIAFIGVRPGFLTLLTGVLTIAASVILLLAYSKVKARKMEGWRLLFWSEVVNLLSSLVVGGIVSVIIGALIGFYLLFQIKSYYK